MLMLRLQRVGRRNDPSFRLVVTEKQNGPRSGKFLEVLGNYDARQGQPSLKAERIKHWLSCGAQTSDTVHNLLVKAKVIEGQTLDLRAKKTGKRLTAAKAQKAELMKTAAENLPGTEKESPDLPMAEP